MEINVKGPAQITAGDIVAGADVDVEPRSVHCYGADGATFHMRMTADKGRGCFC